MYIVSRCLASVFFSRNRLICTSFWNACSVSLCKLTIVHYIDIYDDDDDVDNHMNIST